MPVNHCAMITYIFSTGIVDSMDDDEDVCAHCDIFDYRIYAGPETIDPGDGYGCGDGQAPGDGWGDGIVWYGECDGDGGADMGDEYDIRISAVLTDRAWQCW